MKQQITSYILKKLEGAADEDDLIYSVCYKTGLNWKDAKALVEQVKDEHAVEIEDSQIPLKSLMSFVFYAVGLVLALGPIVYLWFMLDFMRVFLAFASGESLNVDTAIQLFLGRCLLLSWFELPSIFFTILVGFGIIIANLRYMGGIWGALFRKWKVFG